MRRAGDAPVYLVAHDMGTSVATELMARDLEGRLDIELAGALLFNGSIVLERASLTPAQRLLRSRMGRSSRCSRTSAFSASSSAPSFGRHPLDSQEAADQWSLICHTAGAPWGID